MAQRTLLRSQLCESWEETIRGPYLSQQINSERGLQVHFSIAVLRLFRERGVSRRLFVEPTIVFPNGERRSPDLLICNTRRIIGAIEFKYTPRGKPSRSALNKDLGTLARLASSTGKILVANERFQGPGSIQSFMVSPDAVLCWAGVYSSEYQLPFPAGFVESLQGGFLRLDAMTGPNSLPKIETRYFPK